MASCTAGQSFTVTYAGVTAPAVAGSPYPFITQTDIGPGGAGLVNITAGFPTVTVNPLTLTVSGAGLTPDNKIYDGTTNAMLAIGTPTLVGVIGADSVSLVTGSATAIFADKNIGTAKTVTIAGLTLTGAGAGNYTLAQPTRTADITKRPITVTAVTDTKTYDGTNSSIGVPALSGGTPLAPGDTVPAWTQTFDNRNVGTGKTLTPAGAIIDGNNGLNYAYTFAPNTSGAITTKAITVTAATDGKVYDGSSSSSGVPILSGGTPLAPGDTEPTWMQVFDTKNVGAAKTLTPAGKVVDGNGGLNYAYTFIPVTTGIITAKPLTVTADAKTKIYGAVDPAFTASYGGFVNGETAAVLGGTLAFARAPGESVGSYLITPSGLTSTNYAMSFNTGTLSVSQAALSVTADAKTKIYGAVDPAFTASYGGFVNGETAAALGGTLAFARAPGESVGSYLITPSGLTSTNYAISFNPGTLTITAARVPVILSLTAAGTAQVVITWNAVSNVTYRVQYKPDLNATSWTQLGGDVTATNNTASSADVLTTTNRFYRVQELP